MFQIDCLRSQRQKFDAFPKVAITLHHQSTTTKFTTFHKKGSVLLVVSVNKKKVPIPLYPGIVKDTTTSMALIGEWIIIIRIIKKIHLNGLMYLHKKKALTAFLINYRLPN